MGVRVDFVRRFDALRDLTRQSSTEIGPRFGFSYLLTKDAKNVLRGALRAHPSAADGHATPGGLVRWQRCAGPPRHLRRSTATASSRSEFITPPRPVSVSGLQFDTGLHQPNFDEFTIGYRRQFPWQIALDVAGIVKNNHEQFAQVDINGIYPDGPGQRFVGFGAVDPNAGLIYRLTNNTWSETKYKAIQVTMTKNMSKGFQAMFALHRQWAKLDGTYNPTDPARFIVPDAFANDKLIWRTDGVQDHDSLSTGGSLTNNPMWNPYSLRFAGTWQAPWRILMSGSYTIVAGTWSGPLIDQLPAGSSQITPFGPSTVVSSTGVSQSNPLATRIRFVYPTRGEGQVRMEDVHTVGYKIGKIIPLGGGRNVEISGNIFNVFNADHYSEYARTGPNRVYSPGVFLTYTNPQTPRAFQLEAVVRF